MRRYHITVTKKLNMCNHECPNWKHHDGMGYCEDWFTCEEAKPDVVNVIYFRYKDPHNARKVNGFPVWCPLQEI